MQRRRRAANGTKSGVELTTAQTPSAVWHTVWQSQLREDLKAAAAAGVHCSW